MSIGMVAAVAVGKDEGMTDERYASSLKAELRSIV